ncbi:MAG: NAD(P)H-dependent glycerol-3-phosphate dehydrogenase [Lachnospiraceae bacterium]|nr:NAD(P)H-dependent glycerol-3-phosphate dehydrogenase [Lachnospiraceae bacterium]
MKVAMIGCGAWSMAIAAHLARKGCDVAVWAHAEAEAERLTRERALPGAFPGITFPETIVYTHNRAEAADGAELIVFAVASPFTRGTADAFREAIGTGRRITVVTKGIEESTLMTQAEILEDTLPGNTISALSGPTHAEEVVLGLPTTIVSASKSREMAEYVQDLFSNEFLRVYTSHDILGVELGGSLKNVIALAAGMADGLGFGDNLKAAIITRGIYEMSGLAVRMGARIETLQGLSGMGDLIVTCASMHSRNRRAGILIGQGKSMQEAMDEVGQVVEGVYSAKAALALAKKYEAPLPITEEVCRVLFENLSARDAVKRLMVRERRMEWPFRQEDLPECWRTDNSH